MEFSGLKRKEGLESLDSLSLDLIVIGGGITGAGIALDAVARGLKVALFEMQDFAAGTSSRSTKLIHGGLRYLKQLEINVVAEVGRERAIVYENGPHVTTPEWMLLPLYKGGTFGRLSTRLGLTLYDFLARVKKTERKKMLSTSDTLAKEPLLKRDNLIGGGYYVEYKTDDARLTIEVMKKAVELGAQAFNYCKVSRLLYDKDGKIEGVVIEDLIDGGIYSIYAKKIINATGPWVDDIREMDQSKDEKTLLLTKGVHLVFDQLRFPLKQAIYFDTPDGRMCFAIPRVGKTYFGTTDTTYNGNKEAPQMTKEDEKYLLNAVNYIFPTLQLTSQDIESSYAGLRPLIHQEGKGPSEVSRKDEIFISKTGLISIAGGKLTGYRKMAEQVIDKTIALMKLEQQDLATISVDTKQITISGGDVGGSSQFEEYIQAVVNKAKEKGLEESTTRPLAALYGSNIETILGYVDLANEWTEQYEIDLQSALMLAYAINHEMIMKIEDFLHRRTGYLLFNIEKAKQLLEPVSLILSQVLSWSEEERENQKIAFMRSVEYTKSSIINV